MKCCKQEIADHLTLKSIVESMILGRQLQDEDIAIMQKSDQCSLGQWININRQQFSENDYKGLYEAHEKFHKIAMEIYQLHRLEEHHQSAKLVHRFYDLSERIVHYLESVNNKQKETPAKCIAIVDDNPLSLELLENNLVAAGYKVESFLRANVLIDYLQNKKPLPDMVIMDRMMPETSGDSVCSMMHNTPSLKDIPVIMLSALSSNYDVEEGLALGAKDYLTKPFTSEDLIETVKKYI